MPIPRSRFRLLALSGIVAGFYFAGALSLFACPFCSAVQPSLAQRRDAANIAAIGEVLSSNSGKQTLRVHRVVKGKLPVDESLNIAAEGSFKPGTLVIAFADAGEKAAAGEAELSWTLIPTSELGLAYFVKAPDLRQPAKQRLTYYAKYLENADPLLANDAFLEFGHAPVDQVALVADKLPMDKLQTWLADRQIPDGRKGFYALALGLASGERQRADNAEFLRKQIVAPANDFRAGFDGMLAGYLLLSGGDGLKLLDERYFSNPKAADGDVRHALAAARFCHEFAKNIAPADLSATVEHLLARPEFAASAVVDLARWRDWRPLGRIAALYDLSAHRDPGLNRAVVGYLTACPEKQGLEALAALRQRDPAGVAAAEKELATFPGGT